MPEITGDFDHFAYDLKRNRLFVSAEEHHSVEMFDLDTGKRRPSRMPWSGQKRSVLSDLTMSARELQRIEVLTEVVAGRWDVVSRATVLAVSVRPGPFRF